MIPEWANSLAVVDGGLSRFFQATAAASTIGHVCQARTEIQAEKGQRVPCKPPGERELGIVQEVRTWRPIPLGADLFRRPAAPLVPEAVKGHGTQKGYEGPYGICGQTVDLQPLGLT